jgi:hypothetical protein
MVEADSITIKDAKEILLITRNKPILPNESLNEVHLISDSIIMKESD